MGLLRGVFDTDVLIDYLCGLTQATETLRDCDEALISRVTWIEVMVGALGKPEENQVRGFLRRFRVVELDERVAEETVRIRQALRLRLPDATILATARVLGCLLLTRNVRDFNPAWPEIREPYRL